MKIVLMFGGLGNQVFQYIFARWLKESTGEAVYINDAAYYFNSDWNGLMRNCGYELSKVFPNANKVPMLSSRFEPEIWNYMINTTVQASRRIMPGSRLTTDYVVQVIYNTGVDIKMILEHYMGRIDGVHTFTGKWGRTPRDFYNSGMARIPGDVYYRGFWHNPRWFNDYRDILIEEMAFNPIMDDRSKAYEAQIKENFSVGVHIRRGDFIKYNLYTDESFYRTMILGLRDKIPGDAKFFIFSDEIDWVIANLHEFELRAEEVVFVEGNSGNQSYIDLQLMTMCNVLVLSKISSFGLLAALLNQEPGFYYLQPEYKPAEDIATVPKIDRWGGV